MPEQNCNKINPLRLQGTAQEDRSPKLLDPDLVKIDGKTPQDYHDIITKLAGITQYYNSNNRRDGDWEAFFNGITSESDDPHLALFNAFIELIKYAQNDINDLTEKHLAFYYEDVLQIAKKAATPDEAHILFTLANNINAHLVEDETALKAGKDANGKGRVFATNDEIVVNNAKISGLKSVFTKVDDVTGIQKVYAAQIANSGDGIGGDLDEENPKWAAFGKPQAGLDSVTMEDAALGFAIVSPFLLMKEGVRTLELTFTFVSTHEIEATDLTVDDFTIYLSGEEEWISVTPTAVSVPSTSTFAISFSLAADEKPVMGYDEDVFEENYNTTEPILKLLVNQSDSKNVYSKLLKYGLSSVAINLAVNGVTELVLQNETGTLDPSKPFAPFASQPVIGSEFYIGSKEIFSKPLTDLRFDIDWQDRPSVFNDVYDEYSSSTINTSDFKIKLNALRAKSWGHYLSEDDINLFDDATDDIIGTASLGSVFDKVVDVADFDEYATSLNNGFVRMELTGPNDTSNGLIAFGHGQYQDLYVTASINKSRWDIDPDTVVLPKKPYTPKIKSIAVNYSAALTISLVASPSSDSIDGSFFHIGPFGIVEKEPVLAVGVGFIPEFINEGNFYVGLEDLVLPQNLNILFQVAEGSENPDLLPAEIQWKYLVNNVWHKFVSTEILGDSTNGLINSGIIKLALPKTMNDDNTWLPPNYYWLKGEVLTESDSVCELINLHPQAITATFSDNENDVSHLADPLEAETVNKLASSNSAIRKVEQPYASFKGKLPEEEDNYYQRVAERLRHKNRAITIWDYERIVLEEFPSIYKIKCLNHTRMTVKYSEQAPGNVSLVVISNLRNQNAINPFQPTTSLATLQAIAAFLEPLKNPFTTLHVKNPYFEEIKVKFNVRLLPNKDEGFYELQLEIDLKKYLSPWAYEEGEDISFDGIIHKSKIINFIEELDYVDYLTCFEMYHVIEGDESNLKDTNQAEASKSSAILVSSGSHAVTVLTTDDCACDGDNVINETITDGIGAMTVNYDLLVNKP
ncbi:MAG: hypothetical protein GQ574_09450 [Crocinitomix sp.]|nr:hypothetical protein [Crocinitomix sp.]